MLCAIYYVLHGFKYQVNRKRKVREKDFMEKNLKDSKDNPFQWSFCPKDRNFLDSRKLRW